MAGIYVSVYNDGARRNFGKLSFVRSVAYETVIGNFLFLLEDSVSLSDVYKREISQRGIGS